jgi:alginate O-acetyltransferase complex protein AlgI
MIFSSFIFLYLFLPLTVLFYFLSPSKLKNYTLLFASLIFYAWGAPKLLIPLLISCAIDYQLSKQISKNNKYSLYIAIGTNLVLLAYFKYANFFIAEFNQILKTLELNTIAWTNIALPVGISFFTFQKISYLVDVYRKDTSPARSYVDYTLYVILFPQLIAGPIVRYLDVARQIISRAETSSMFICGIYRFSIGLAKKVLIADALGSVADYAFNLPAEQLTSEVAWLGIITYALQIYFDFSGYSDMAIGLGWIFGFQFKENFNKPYISQSITEFWRRWHISLSSFMREYLYYPLGGNKLGHIRTYFNLWLVFLLSGFWHGANWTFILWGIYHGLFLILDRLFLNQVKSILPKFINITLTLFLVLIGWVLFRADNLQTALDYYSALFNLNNPLSAKLTPRAYIIDNRTIFILFIAIFIALNPFTKHEALNLNLKLKNNTALRYTVSSIFLIILATAYLVARGHSPFLYYKF